MAGRSFDLSFITDNECLSDQEKITIYEWLVHLESTQDYTTTSQQALAEAVCGMLESLQDNSSFKENFFAQVSQNLEDCGDRAAMALNELYLAWKLDTLDPQASEKDQLNLMLQAAKTAALRTALQKEIEKEETRLNQEGREAIFKEGAETYLYYEIHLRDKLSLLTFMTDMLYEDIGERDWIKEDDLIKAVNSNYLEEMIGFLPLQAMRDKDEDFISVWNPLDEEFRNRMDELDENQDELSSHDYNNKCQAIQKERELKKNQQTLRWLQNKLIATHIV